MTIGIPCNPCSNGFCGNCVGDKLQKMGFVRNASDHCSCADKGHTNVITKDLPNKTVFSKKKDTEPSHSREIQADTDDDFKDNEE